MNLEEFAGAARDLAGRAEGELALKACNAGAKDFLAVLRTVTPKRSGKLMDSETVTGPVGSGMFAVAQVGPHIVYAKFRNDGGTITAKEGLGRKGMRPHTLHWEGGGFPRQVTQAGAHYMEKAEAAAPPAVEAAVRQVAGEFIRL